MSNVDASVELCLLCNFYCLEIGIQKNSFPRICECEFVSYDNDVLTFKISECLLPKYSIHCLFVGYFTSLFYFIFSEISLPLANFALFYQTISRKILISSIYSSLFILILFFFSNLLSFFFLFFYHFDCMRSV